MARPTTLDRTYGSSRSSSSSSRGGGNRSPRVSRGPRGPIFTRRKLLGVLLTGSILAAGNANVKVDDKKSPMATVGGLCVGNELCDKTLAVGGRLAAKGGSVVMAGYRSATTPEGPKAIITSDYPPSADPNAPPPDPKTAVKYPSVISSGEYPERSKEDCDNKVTGTMIGSVARYVINIYDYDPKKPQKGIGIGVVMKIEGEDKKRYDKVNCNDNTTEVSAGNYISYACKWAQDGAAQADLRGIIKAAQKSPESIIPKDDPEVSPEQLANAESVYDSAEWGGDGKDDPARTNVYAFYMKQMPDGQMAPAHLFCVDESVPAPKL
ncbi:MAG: hypothetical protein V4702_02400 [Patescibacteria group bacterium]